MRLPWAGHAACMPRWIVGPILVAGVPACGGGSSGDGDPSRPVIAWGQFRADRQNRGRSEAPGLPAGGVEWAVDLGSPITAAATLVDDGVRVKPAGPNLVSIRSDGAEEWRAKVGPGSRTPALDRSGAAYLGTDDGFLVKVSFDGRIVWRLSVGVKVGTGLVYRESTVLFAAVDGQLFFVGLNGELQAMLQVGPVADSIPVFTEEDQIFVASTDGNLYEIQLDPATHAPVLGITLALPGGVSRCTPASSNTAVYVVTDADVLVKARKDRFEDEPGRIVWTFDPGSGTSTGGASSPAIDRDGTVYFGTQDGRLIAVSSSGTPRWSRSFAAAVSSSPILDGHDHVYVRTQDGWFHSFTKDGELRFRCPRDEPGTGVDPSPSMDRDGNVYLPTPGGLLLKLGNGPVLGQAGHDSRHSGAMGTQGPAELPLEWSRDLGAAPGPPALVLPGGSFLFATANRVDEVARSGELVRSTSIPGLKDVVLGPNGLTYALTRSGRLEARQRDGTVEFVRKLAPRDGLAALTVASDGTLRVALRSGSVLVLDADGRTLQELPGILTEVAPAVSDAGDTVVATTTGRLLSFAPDGVRRFAFALPGPVSHGAPVVGDDGTIYVATDDDVIAAVSAAGQGRWVFDPAGGPPAGGFGGPILGASDTVVYATRSGTLVGLDAGDGGLLFSVALGGEVLAPPVRDSGGTVFVATAAGGLHVVSPAGTLLPSLGPEALGGAAVHHTPVLPGGRSAALIAQSGEVTVLRTGVTWSTFHGRPDHRGRQTATGPAAGTVLWSLPLGGTLELSPVLSEEGDVLVHTSEGELVVADSSGMEIARVAVGQGPGVPLILESGRRLTGARSGVLQALDEQYQKTWFRSFSSAVAGLNVGLRGEILVGSGARLFALDEDGDELWRSTVGTLGEGAPAVHRDGSLRVGTADATLVSLDASGGVLFHTPLPGAVRRSSPLVAPDGTSYVTTDADELVAVDAGGSVLWTFDPVTSSNQGGRAAPALAADGSLRFGAVDGFLYAVEKDGTPRFAVDTGGPVHSAPILDGAGVTFVGSDSGSLFAVDAAGGVVFSVDPSGGTPSPLTSLALGNDGALYVGSAAGVLYCIQD